MKTGALLLLSLALGGCASAPPASQADRFFADHLFRAPSQAIDARQVLALSDEMKGYLAREIGAPAGHKGRQRALVEALRDKGQLKLEYDAAFTRNAAEAFEARSGNCLSLVLMTAAFARQMGVPVRYQSLYFDETWSRHGNTYFSIGHVNLTLGARPPKVGSQYDEGEQLTVDFLPPRDLRGTIWKKLGEDTILAMYMNNRAAESLAADNVDDAYWFAREAIRQDPQFVTLYNTLGVVYRRHGNLDEAAKVLAHGLKYEPRNISLMSNMATVLADLGRIAESRELEAQLAQIDPEPPFAFFNRGVAAMRAGDFSAARDFFTKEIDRAPFYHEFHFWLALALFNLGDNERAGKELALAMENSTTRRDHDLYAAKMVRLKSSGLH